MNTASKNGFLFGLLMPGDLRAKKEATMYSYNGVVLPKLPEWDKETYPYVIISFREPNILYKFYSAKVRIYSDMVVGDAAVTNDFNATVGGMEYSIAWNDGEEVPNDWSEAVVYEAGANANTQLATAFEFIAWTNTDITASDSSWSMAASDPIPVYE